MRICAAQLDVAWEDKRTNFGRLEALLARDPPGANALIVLPEMSFTGFSMNVPRIAEGEPELTETYLGSLAQRIDAHFVAGRVTQASDGRGRNEAVSIDRQGRIDCRYQKLHLFSPAGEDRHYEPGRKLAMFVWQGGAVAPFICYDLRFPEAFRSSVSSGAEMFVVIANWPRAREHHWRTLLQARAIENQAIVVGVNRCGRDPQVEYSGRSMIVAPDGSILAEADEREQMIVADLDWGTVRRCRRDFRVLDDRRPELWNQAMAGDGRHTK